MPRIYAIHKKEQSYISFDLEDICNDLNNKIIKTNQFKFFTKENEAIKYQSQLINKKTNRKELK